eukprot:jgi/Psemu1/31734/gm1.31734_g
MIDEREIDTRSVHEALIMNIHSGNDDDHAHNMYKKPKTLVRRRLVTVKCADVMLDWVVFPLLLFVQFGTSMYCQQHQGRLNIPWVPTMTTIAIFCIASVEYRKVFRIHPIQSMAALLIPELFTNTILATVMLADDLSIALYSLILLTVVIVVIAMIGRFQLSRYRVSAPVPTANDYKLLDRDEDDEDYGDEYVC